MLREHEHENGSRWAAMQSIAAKIGGTAQTLSTWVRKPAEGVLIAGALLAVSAYVVEPSM